MKKIITLLLFIPFISVAQEQLNGRIFIANEEDPMPLAGANVYWLHTTIGTVTDLDGNFSIPSSKDSKELIISYVGFKTDTLKINAIKPIHHYLHPTNNLDEVEVTTRKKSTLISFLNSQNLVTMNSEELLKSACCNLCESFETNPSIDVNYADALTGTRQIKMLGLTSPYILTAIESVPTVRGAAQMYGLSFVPGTWVESIQITKGTGSVISGFESIAGQINAKLQKPVEDSKVFVNIYGAGNGRFELNTHLNTKITDKLYTGLFLHGNIRDTGFDRNKDSFLDIPLAKQVNLMNRWQYVDLDKGVVSFLNVRYLNDAKQAGQTSYNPEADKFSTNYWGSDIDTKRLDVSGKLSYANQDLTYQNVDIQVNFSTHNQQSYFGRNVYNINHNNFYTRAIYSSILGSSLHKFKAGLNFSYDHYDETVGVYTNTMDYERNENSIGVFFEYNYDDLENINLTAGIRIDNSNLLGTFLTPRLNMRYTPWEQASFKTSIGSGRRSSNIFAENQNMFASSRLVNLLNSGGKIYGLDPEIAWNYGISFLQGFNLFGREADLAVDFYRTDFKNQVVVDWENPSEVSFYNLDGESYANSFQTELNYNFLEGVDLRLAYKYYDVKTQYTSGKLTKPLTPKHRFFANAAYKTKMNAKGGHWKFDTTYNWLGEQRFPSTAGNPEQYRLTDYTPTVGTLNVQITKVFAKSFEVYVGGENITNERIKSPIMGADDPFGNYFDTTFVYGPIFGSTYYAGLRYRLN
ncbi:TonB-dependent receptor [Snuella sedimenti]|uniref:TonB-dependent receptor n=1 Tax=Snuella sedimenti TaxID=2798802 RepID=A0A8J7IM72_9FLAO|nr:TonB-dependent receptor [Snuella sedimenti]MBJ6367002.1 TonB-dependent receptor [Snuella sedimenti]